MSNYAIVENGIVTNIVTWDGDAEKWSAPDGAIAVAISGEVPVCIGWTYADGTFSDPDAPPAPTAEEIAAQQAQAFQSTCTFALQQMLDSLARAWGYDSIVSAASYATSSNAQFAAEAKTLIDWRDAVWSWGYAYLADIQSGKQKMPASVDALLAKAPAAPDRPGVTS